MTLVVRGMRQINIFVFSMGFIPALKIEASGGSQARKRKARRGKYARGVLDNAVQYPALPFEEGRGKDNNWTNGVSNVCNY